MNPFLLGGLSVVALLGLLSLGIPIAFAAAFVGIVGLLIFQGPTIAWMYASTVPFSEVASYAFIIIPLFTIMGDFAFYGGLAEGLFYTTSRWVGRLPGGLGIAAAIGGAGFGACCGSSVAASAVLSKICIPEMRKHNYPPSTAAGVVAASANLSSLIPPSGLFIVYAIVTDQSVGKLLIAGILPGILVMILFSVMLIIRCSKNPSLGPSLPQKVSWGEKLRSITRSWGMLVCAAIIVAGIYTGIFTSSEAAVAAGFWTFCLAIFSGNMSFKKLMHVLTSTATNTAMILFIIAGVMLFTRFLAVSRMPTELATLLSNLPVSPIVILLCIMAFYFFLGMFFDAISMLVMTLPAFFPTVVALGYDPIWFGVICVLMCEIGLITPPVGVNCYVVSATASDVSLKRFFAAFGHL
jgi:tripartite ATP-independent transporter DctM subunit